jgi:hypothetical protein
VKSAMSDNTRIFKMPFVNVYPAYIQKAERKGRTKEEVDEIIFWLTGYNQKTFQKQIGGQLRAGFI